MTDFLVHDLGLRSYAEALSFQREVAAQRISKATAEMAVVLTLNSWLAMDEMKISSTKGRAKLLTFVAQHDDVDVLIGLRE